jgi:hypothetical protein
MNEPSVRSGQVACGVTGFILPEQGRRGPETAFPEKTAREPAQKTARHPQAAAPRSRRLSSRRRAGSAKRP